MNTKTPELDTFLRDQLNKQLLKYAAGTAISCPQCGDIMDCRRTVSAELSRNWQGKGEEIIGSYVMCGKCWDKVAPRFVEGIAKANAKAPELQGKIDIVDGRTMDWNEE